MSEQYKMVAENPQSTVVSDYEPRYRTAKQYQSEAEMEKEFIEQLQTQAYDYLPITSEKELIENLRCQLEKLNGYRFTDKEWTAFFKEKIANQNSGIVEKTAIVQDDILDVVHYQKLRDCVLRLLFVLAQILHKIEVLDSL
jgi:type I restriction enzyme R subunit